MGQVCSNSVKEPKNQYEYSKNDPWLTDDQLDMEYIQEQLRDDAKVVEDYIIKNGIAYFPPGSILRVKLEPNKYWTNSKEIKTHAVINTNQRIRCLIKNLNVSFSYYKMDGIPVIIYVHSPKTNISDK